MKNREQEIKRLRELVVNYNGPLTESPHYQEFARLVVSEFIADSAFLSKKDAQTS